MKSTKSLLFGLILLIGQFSFHAYADAIKTVGTTGADYATLRLAFNAVNAGTLTGAIQLQIIDNTAETSTAVLYQSGYGSVSNYSSIQVYPTVTGKTITTSGATFSILINLNAANNVTFDGRLHDVVGTLTGSTKDLTLINTFSGSPGLMVFQFLNNASNNTITYCNIKGSNAGTSKGVISLITPVSTNSATGSANNTISNNTFTFAGTTRPLCVVYSQGIPASPNTGNKLLDNEFVNCINPSGGPGAVTIAADNTAWTISGNSFYETAAFTPVAGTYTFISIISGNGNTISNNNIGGSAAQCGGSPLSKTGNIVNAFRGIYINSAVTAGLPSTIENNTIKNITWSNGTSTAIWTGISITGAHDVNVIGNTIGNISVTNSALGSNVIGIEKTNGTALRDIRNNFISGLTISAASTGQLYGIRLAGGLSSVSNNIISLSTDNAVEILGIYDSGVSGKTTQMYFNTVQIGGNPSTSNEGSYCFFGMAASNTRDFRNNIFVNTRTNGGSPAASGSHYAAYFNYSAITSLTLSNNNYFVSGTGGVLGYASGNKTSLPLIIGVDANSMNVNPAFAIPTGTAAVDFKPSSATLVGVSGTGITTDYSGAARNTPTMGAWEVTASADLATLAATVAATSITDSGASTGGEVTAIGTSAITARGVCWSTTTTPTLPTTNKTDDGTDIGSFTSSITGLSPGTKYYVRAYATNTTGTAYGEEINFTTLFDVPTLATTDAATSITANAATSGGNVTVEGTSAVTDRGVCWSTSTLPTVALTTKTSDGTGTGSFTSSITGLSSAVKYYVRAYATNTTGTAYGAEISFTTLDNESPTAFTATIGAVGGTTVELLLNATDNSGSIAYTISYGAGPTVLNTTGVSGVQKSYIVTGLTEATAYTFSVVVKDATLNAAANNPIEVASTTLSLTPTLAAPTPPARVAGDVKSIFSEVYTNVSGTVFNPSWGQATTVSNVQIASNTTMKYSTFNFEGTNIGSDLNLSTLGMTHIHFDVWSPDETLIRFSLIQRTPQSEKAVNSTITTGTWNSFDIPISDFTSQGLAVSAIYQLKIEGSKWYPTNTANRTTVFLDNIYFYKAVPGAPTSAVATPGNAQASVAFTAPAITGGSAITGYTVTSSPDGLISTGASSPLIVNGLTNGTPYTFTVMATNAQGTGAASAASNEVTPHATNNIINVASSVSISDLTLTGVSDLKILSGGTLTVNASKTVNSISVESGGKLNVQPGQPLTLDTLILKAGKDAGSFSAKIEANINATNVSYLKTIDDTKWYFMSFPCAVAVSDIKKSNGETLGVIGTDWFIKYYDGNKRSVDGVSAGTNWLSVTEGTLTANKGYIFGLKTGKPDTEILFPLSTGVLTAETESVIPVLSYSGGAAGISHLGWNLVGQPYLSNYASQTGSNAPFMITSDGISTYTSYSNALGQLPAIKPFDAYFVQAGAGLETSGLTFLLAGRQSAPASVATNVSENIQLNVTTATGVDNTYLIMDNDQTPGYQIGQDLEKWIGTGTIKPQIYTLSGGVNYAFNALPMDNVVNLPVGFYTKTAGITTISVNASQAPGVSKLLLTDNINGTTTDLLASDYNFNANAGTDNSRFVITAQRVITDNNFIESGATEPGISMVNGKLLMLNLSPSSVIRVYDATGRMVYTKTAINSSLEVQLKVKGLYIVQIGTATNNWTSKIVNQK